MTGRISVRRGMVLELGLAELSLLVLSVVEVVVV